MRWYGEPRYPALPPDVSITWQRCPQAARELVELNARELAPPPEPPFAKLFPPSEGGGSPPGGFGAPPETPPAVLARVRQLIRSAEAGTLYESDPAEIAKPEIKAADDVYDRAVKDSKARQDAKVAEARGVSLFFLLLIGPIPLAVFAASFVFGRRGV